MLIRWLGHACFVIKQNGYTIVIDPYNHRYVPGYPELRVVADQVLVSHEHYGHNNREGVKLTGRSESRSPFKITSFDVGHDNILGRMRGMNRVHILEGGGVRVAHMGDIGTFLTAEQKERLYGVDALMIGAGSNRALPAQDAAQIVEDIRPHVVIPMHYRFEGYGPRRLEHIEAFTYLFESHFVKEYDTDTILIEPGMDFHIAVLKYLR